MFGSLYVTKDQKLSYWFPDNLLNVMEFTMAMEIPIGKPAMVKCVEIRFVFQRQVPIPEFHSVELTSIFIAYSSRFVTTTLLATFLFVPYK